MSRAEAERLAELGEYEEAIRMFSKCLPATEKGREAAEVYEMIAQCELELGTRPERAIEMATASVFADSEWTQAHLTLARCHLNAGNFSKAVTNFERVLAREPDHPEVAADLALARRRCAQGPALSLDMVRAQREKGSAWTVVDGVVYDVGSFRARHPGGDLILRAVGEDASLLLRAHHANFEAVQKALQPLAVGPLGSPAGTIKQEESPFLAKTRALMRDKWEQQHPPLAELVAVSMLAAFACWLYFAYSGSLLVNVALSWFWARQLDSGLHSVSHGDFRRWTWLHNVLLNIYGVLTFHMFDYYYSSGVGSAPHFTHHLHTNSAQDPDWRGFVAGGWLRRHSSTPWRLHHRYQLGASILIRCLVEPVRDLLNMCILCLSEVSSLLDPPRGPSARTDTYQLFLPRCCCVFLEALLNPSYQGLLFVLCPFQTAFPTWLLSRAVAKLVLWPFAEVQHFLPEHRDMRQQPPRDWAVDQLATTANLKLSNPLLRVLDFLMFYGDTYQVEHHLFPGLSFVLLPKASHYVRAVCKLQGVKYLEFSYWEGYQRIFAQLVEHSEPEKTA